VHKINLSGDRVSAVGACDELTVGAHHLVIGIRQTCDLLSTEPKRRVSNDDRWHCTRAWLYQYR